MSAERTWKDWNDETEPQELRCIAGPWDGERYLLLPSERTVIPIHYEHGYYEVMGTRRGYALVWQRGAFWLDYAQKLTPDPPTREGDV